MDVFVTYESLGDDSDIHLSIQKDRPLSGHGRTVTINGHDVWFYEEAGVILAVWNEQEVSYGAQVRIASRDAAEVDEFVQEMVEAMLASPPE